MFKQLRLLFLYILHNVFRFLIFWFVIGQKIMLNVPFVGINSTVFHRLVSQETIVVNSRVIVLG